MTEHPLGDIDGTDQTPVLDPAEAFSPVDTILKLDDFLAGDVRRAEKTARFCTRPDIEAEIEALNSELDSLTDSEGRPLVDVDRSVADDGRSVFVVNEELKAKQREYHAAMVSVRMRQIDEDDWTAFLARHKQALEGGLPYPPEVYEDLISRTAVAPKFTVDQVRAFRAKVGHPVFQELAGVAWMVNTQSGVSIPKSSLSSAVSRQQRRG